jgi:diguanylate cyclase (GGDEF)-like protein
MNYLLESGLVVTIIVSCLTIIMWFTSLLLEDLDGEKPARHAFHIFYSLSVILFIIMTIQMYQFSPILTIISDICIAVMHASLLIGILWRCNSTIPDKLIYTLALIYIVLDALSESYGVRIALSYVAICSLIGGYSLLTRRPMSNRGDKGMGIISLCCAGLLFAYMLLLGEIVDNEDYMKTMVYIFIFVPAYFSGLTIFLFLSYMIDAKIKLSIQATTDPMTGLYNRRFLTNEFGQSLSSDSHSQYPLSVIICDIDNFKMVNDNYGHYIGDIVIKEFSLTLRSTVRNCDILVRLGGEEFIVILPNTDNKNAAEVAERIRSKMEKSTTHTSKGELSVTASFGVCETAEYIDIQLLIKRADEALYKAKENGRNQVRLN